jgi:pimeloyl-ACP methyl ester carboxylesterase
VAWTAALLRPDRFPAVVGLSVACWEPGFPPNTALFRKMMGEGFFYVLYFQAEGVAEAEMDADIRGTLRRVFYSLSADNPPDRVRFLDPTARCFNDLLQEPDGPSEWFTDEDLDVYTTEFERSGTFRPALNWYRCMDRNAALMSPFAGQQLHQPALFIGGDRDLPVATQDSVLATRKWVPNLGEPVWIDHCGHWVQQEQPDRVNETIIDFLRTLR